MELVAGPQMSSEAHGGIADLKTFTDADAALARINEIYSKGTAAVRARLAAFTSKKAGPRGGHPCYPYVGITITPDEINLRGDRSFGKLPGAGTFGTTLTRPG